MFIGKYDYINVYIIYFCGLDTNSAPYSVLGFIVYGL